MQILIEGNSNLWSSKLPHNPPENQRRENFAEVKSTPPEEPREVVTIDHGDNLAPQPVPNPSRREGNNPRVKGKKITLEEGEENDLHSLPCPLPKKVGLKENTKKEKLRGSSPRILSSHLGRFENRRVPLSSERELINLESDKSGNEEAETSPTAQSGEGKRSGDIPDFFELFLETNPKGKKAGEVFKPIDEPTFIVLAEPEKKNHRCLKLIHNLCCQSLREFEGGEIGSDFLMSGFGEEELAGKYVEEFGTVILDEDSIRGIENSQKGSKRSKLEKWIQKFSGLGLRYVIFEVKESNAAELYERLNENDVGIEGRVFYLRPKDLNGNLKRRISSLAWGFLNVGGESYRDAFRNGREAYRNILDEVRNQVKRNWKKYPRVKGAEASPRHGDLKHFAVKHLVDQDGIGRREVLVEDEETGSELGRKPDVYDERRSIAVEIETLYGTGTLEGDPISKIRDYVISDYKESSRNLSEVWIVLENITALRNLKRLVQLESYYQDNRTTIGFTVKCLVPDLDKRKLTSLERLVQETSKVSRLCSLKKEKEIEESSNGREIKNRPGEEALKRFHENASSRLSELEKQPSGVDAGGSY